jgi:ribose/xylose/arabinose/galactoside ABC-type transport system permease subunit
MLNVKALASAFAVTSAVAFCFYVVYALMVPQGYGPGPVWGSWLPDFRWISMGKFLLGLFAALLSGAFAGWLVGTLNNFFQRLWATAH